MRVRVRVGVRVRVRVRVSDHLERAGVRRGEASDLGAHLFLRRPPWARLRTAPPRHRPCASPRGGAHLRPLVPHRCDLVQPPATRLAQQRA